jgi:hypothetical protein
MQIDRFIISRRSKYSDHKPNQLCCTVELVDGENKQQVELDDHVIVAVLEVIRDATACPMQVTSRIGQVNARSRDRGPGPRGHEQSAHRGIVPPAGASAPD